MIALNAPPSDTRERPTAASTAPLPDPRPGRRGQAPKPRSGAPKAQGLTAAIAVVAPSAVPSIALDFTGVKAPIDPSTTSQIYTSLTDVTLASYVGLTPSPHMSGGLSREQGISKSGNPRARTALVEAAWLWLRYQPRSALAKWFAQRVGEQRGRIRQIMVVALARKLLVALWRYVETGLVPTGATLRA